MARAACELATEVFVRHSHLYLAVGTDLSSYGAYVAAEFYCAVMNGLPLFAIDLQHTAVIRVLLLLDFIKPVRVPIHDTCAAPIGAVTSQLAADYKNGRHISVGEVALVDMAVVSPDFAGHGVYRALRIALAIHACDRGYRFVVRDLSSTVTQRLFLDRPHHKNCAELVLADMSLMANDHLLPFIPHQNHFGRRQHSAC